MGEAILSRTGKDNPYWHWIETYGDEMFARSTERAVEICDELAETAAEDVRERMTEAFLMAARMEWMFWESAYRMEQWKI